MPGVIHDFVSHAASDLAVIAGDWLSEAC